jgi:hypothetical protein
MEKLIPGPKEGVMRTNSGLHADRERWQTPCDQHGASEARAPSSQHALGLGGPMHFCAAITGRGPNQGQGKTMWTECDKFKWRDYPITGGRGERGS